MNRADRRRAARDAKKQSKLPHHKIPKTKMVDNPVVTGDINIRAKMSGLISTFANK